jgi:hypothetical protein
MQLASSIDSDWISAATMTAGFEIVVLGMAVGLVALLLWVLSSVEGDDSDDSGGDGPGPGKGGGGGPSRPPDNDEPVWWPAFERQLADYVASRAATRSLGQDRLRPRA